MHSNRRYGDNTSTPKRRRLGTGRFCQPSHDVFQKHFSPVRPRLCVVRSPARCESPPIPCNQIEYLCDSGNNNNNSNTSNAPPSPGLFENSLDLGTNKTPDSYVGMSNLKNCLLTQRNKVLNTTKYIQDEVENMSDDMFQSRQEVQESISNNHELLISRCESNFRQNIEDSFDLVNQSICDLDTNKPECGLESNDNKTCGLESKNNVEENDLFETKDSFLLDIKDTCAIIQENGYNDKPTKSEKPVLNQGESFYGLPLLTKGLFKTFRSIEKFYDWQEECLNLDAIRNRQNLIYALPTSGGKTLVAEVLMLREVLNRRKNTLFILPFVAIVQEKIWALSPFAVQLGFLVEEYAAGKGHIPPKKRRRKNSIYIATIEKALALLRSLIEGNRLNEIGLIVVDELHLIGESGRGSTLETLLTTVIYANQGIQIVGMSATIGNLPELARFLSAAVFERHFRPVELAEYVKRGDVLHRLRWREGGFDLEPERALSYDYSPAATALDPDWLGGLVSEVTPAGSCLVFCPTKRNCENVAALLCKMQRREMSGHRATERRALSAALVACGAGAALCGVARCGVAWHHAGLAGDERTLLEDGFRTGVLSVLCCTSTLAAGVNLPAQRVIIRAPLVGREPLTLAAYRQMAGRAGRKGQCEIGESIIICDSLSWPALRCALGGGVSPARSGLAAGAAAGELLLSAVSLRLATTRPALAGLMRCTLMHVQADSLNIDTNQVCDDAIRSLLQNGAIEVARQADRPDETRIESGKCHVYNDSELIVSSLGNAAIKVLFEGEVKWRHRSGAPDGQVDESRIESGKCHVYNDSELGSLENAAIKGCLDLASARLLLQDLETASRGLVLLGSVHLLYLVTPQQSAVRPDLANYYSLYCNMNEECLQTAKILGITEKTAVRMMTGKHITNVPESVLARFYLALVLYDLWNQVPFSAVVEKYNLSRGTVQQLMTSAASMAASASRACEQLGDRWAFRALFAELAPRLQHCGAPELAQLLDLPGVKKTRALQLSRAGYKRVEDIARASPDGLTSAVAHLSRAAAEQLVSAARLLLIEKVENLRSEAEDVMEELNMK